MSQRSLVSSIEVDRSTNSIFWRLVAAPAQRRRPEADIQGESTSSPILFFEQLSQIITDFNSFGKLHPKQIYFKYLIPSPSF